jgi:salicylate biosynthesis isochorismate synthase/menaquinone-specific isochorismate synthase
MPDLVDLVATARDGGREVMLFERPMPDAVSVAAIGRSLDLVTAPGGVQLENAEGHCLDREPGADRLQAAARLWRRLASTVVADEDPRLPGTGLIAVGGFAFEPHREPGPPWAGFPGVLLRVPEMAVVRVRGRTFVSSQSPGLFSELSERQTLFRAPAARHVEVTPVQDPAGWQEAVAEAAAMLAAGGGEKVVLAREVMARGDGEVSAGAVLRSLRGSYPSCFTYLVTGADGTALAGASPELLARRLGSAVTSQPMAGSAPRGEDDEDDDRIAARLLGNRKDAREHAVVVSQVVEGLVGMGAVVSSAGQPEVVRFTNIQHLATTVRARLAGSSPASVLEVCAALHPTPAVAGHPLKTAMSLIRRLEGIERGWYTGGVGWVDGRGDGEFAVALRCGLLWEDGARIYAGVGVMADSDPAGELAETELKFKALLAALAT